MKTQGLKLAIAALLLCLTPLLPQRAIAQVQNAASCSSCEKQKRSKSFGRFKPASFKMLCLQQANHYQENFKGRRLTGFVYGRIPPGIRYQLCLEQWALQASA